jgi:signal transduction histidine kinase
MRPWLRLVPYRLRLLLRAAFLLLALATLGLALSLLQQEKQLSYKNYQAGFQKTRGQIAATLRHPSGQLALLNPDTAPSTALHPLLLPFAALDFDDPQKVQQAVAISGCLMQYGAGATLCVGIGNNPWAGGFIYVAGSVASASLVPHRHGDEVLKYAHRLRVSVRLRGQRYDWIAPFEEAGDDAGRKLPGMHGRLTGFRAADEGSKHAYAVKDFRGWIWQNAACNEAGRDEDTCLKNAFFSLRLPVGVLRDALFDQRRPVWPPADLQRIAVDVTVLPPGDGAPLLDSASRDVVPPFSLKDLRALLLPGETLQIVKQGDGAARQLVALTGAAPAEDRSWHLLTTLIRHLPVDAWDVPLQASDAIATPAGSYAVSLKGDVRSVSESLSVVASRMAWFVGAMLLALFVAWLVIEIGIIRRIKVLSGRADAVARTVKGTGALERLDLSDLRGEDELGVLASCLHDLLRRVREDVEREGIRAEQERDMWHAVGHEIMSPLQSLIALHGAQQDPSHRYINRMQQAVRVLYGSATPSEGFQSTVLQMTEVDLCAFLRNVAQNAPCVGIADVLFEDAGGGPVLVRADDYSLEDVVTHVLRNAERHRLPGSAITIALDASETGAAITIHNCGPQIAAQMIDKIFEYGVSDQAESGANGSRGQGLFVAKIYMAKMGGTISAHNRADGVSFILNLQRIIE